MKLLLVLLVLLLLLLLLFIIIIISRWFQVALDFPGHTRSKLVYRRLSYDLDDIQSSHERLNRSFVQWIT